MNEFGLKKGIVTLVLGATLLTGCGSNGDAQDNSTSKSDKLSSVIVLFGDKTATIIEDKYVYYYTSGELVILEFSDGSRIKTTSDMMILSEFTDYAEVLDLVRDVVGEDGEINYYSHDNSSVKTR